MSGSPKNASLNGSGFRFYRWEPKDGSEPTDVLSVTSIRKLTGESYQLVAWQINNIVNVAMGTTKRTVVGPRGGRSDIYVTDGWAPAIDGRPQLDDDENPIPTMSEFMRRAGLVTGQKTLDDLRAFLRDTADRPRDTAAMRGTIVHEAIEIGARTSQVDESYVQAAAGRLSSKDQNRLRKHGGITGEDVDFVADAVANYWDMRVNVPFVILAREVQVWNLTAGYGGSADVLAWFLPEGTPMTRLAELQKLANAGKVDQAMVVEVGGEVVLGDWKTSSGIWTDQIVQVHAYMAAEFIGTDGVVDARLTELLNNTRAAALIHIRPDGWAVHFFDFTTPPLRAFLGSVAFARFVATYPDPEPLFTRSVKGKVEAK